jgi:hypothetical protein
MTKKTIFAVVLIALVFTLIGGRKQFSALFAQPKFKRATFVQLVYYNCTPGEVGCEPKGKRVMAFNQDQWQVTEDYQDGSPLPAERKINTPEEQINVIPAINQFFSIKRKATPPPEVFDFKGDCGAYSKGYTFGGVKDVLGYVGVIYRAPNGWSNLFFPDLGCASVVERLDFPAQPGHPATTTTYVMQSIVPGFDPTLFKPGPGMVDTMPREAIHNKLLALYKTTNRTPEEAEKVRSMNILHDPTLPRADAQWRRLHPGK